MGVGKKGALAISRRGCAYSCAMPGVWRAAAHNEGALVIFHSPKACAHVVREMDLGDYYRSAKRREFLDFSYRAPLLSSNLRDEHSIFGGEEQLSCCIDYALKRYSPEYILIASSCVAGTIGDDVAAIAQKAAKKWGVPVMPVPGSGFLDAEYYGGLYHTAHILIDTFMQKRLSPKTEMVTLLGERGGATGEDAKEIQCLIAGFGLRVNCLFPGRSSVAEMMNIPSSALCIPLGAVGSSQTWLWRLAGYLETKFDIPFLKKSYPVGRAETNEWLMALGNLLRQKEAAALSVRIQEERLRSALENKRDCFKGLGAVLCIGRPPEFFKQEWVFEMMELLNIRLDGVMLCQELTAGQKCVWENSLKNYTKAAILDEKDALPQVRQAGLLITTHELEDVRGKQFYLPVLPPLGIGGLIKIIEKMAGLAKNKNSRGNIVYGW